MPGRLVLTRYRVAFEALEPLDLPAYLGSTLRGAFGHAFRSLCCPARPGETCPLPADCPYHLVFETGPPPGAAALRTHEEIPRPFVIAPAAPPGGDEPGGAVGPAGGATHPPGSEVAFDLTLVGRAREFLPHFIVAFREVDRIGRGRRAVRLARVEAVQPLTHDRATVHVGGDSLVRPVDWPVSLEDCRQVPCPEDAVRIRFVTQTRLKHGEAIVRRPDFHVLFRRLLGRLSSLARFHCGAPLDVDFRGLIAAAGVVQLVRDETRWTRWARYSARQDRRMEWDGIVGEVAYEGELRPFWPYLVLGQWLHVGKGATFGLGRYEVQA